MKKPQKRVRVEDPLRRLPGLKPVARPVDTFVRPAEPMDFRKSLGMQLVGALNLGVERYQKDVVEPWKEEERARARAEFEASAYKGFDDAVKSGLIKPGQSPAFQREWKLGELRIKARNMDTALREAYAANEEIRGTDEPEKVLAWAAEFRQQWTEENGIGAYDVTELQDGFWPLAEQSMDGLVKNHSTRRTENIEQEVEENARAEIVAILNDGLDADATPEAIAEQVALVNEPYIRASRNRSAAAKSTTDAFITAYLDSGGDETIIDALNKVPAGPGSFLGGTTYAKEEVYKARDHLSRERERRERLDYWRTTKRRAETTHSILMDAIPAITANPGDEANDMYFEALSEVNPEAAKGLIAWRERMLDIGNRVREDRGEVATLFMDILNGNAGAMDIVDMAADGRLADPAEAIRFLDRADAMRHILNDTTFRDMRERLEKTIMRYNSDPSVGGVAGQATQLADQAVFELSRRAMTWVDENGGPGGYSRNQLFRFLEDEYERIVKSPVFVNVVKGFVEPVNPNSALVGTAEERQQALDAVAAEAATEEAGALEAQDNGENPYSTLIDPEEEEEEPEDEPLDEMLNQGIDTLNDFIGGG